STHKDAETIKAIQQARTLNMIAFARSHSRYYQKHYAHLPSEIDSLQQVPVVKKADLMEHFDEWVTDPIVTKREVDAFVEDWSLIGRYYKGQYTVAKTSGTTGVPGIIIQDKEARSLYQALYNVRGWPGKSKVLKDWFRYAWYGYRSIYIGSTMGHQGSYSSQIREAVRNPRYAENVRTLSILKPVAELVSELNRFQPTSVLSQPSITLTLAREQLAGRLHIRPFNIFLIGETLEDYAREEIERAFADGKVWDIYTANEFRYMAFNCRHNWLHVNEDWVILEPVDEAYQPTPAGQRSYSTLMTNLVNHIQPFIRYELGDRILVRPDSCPCGNRFPAIRVEGRTWKVLTFTTRENVEVNLAGLMLNDAIKLDTGIKRYQLVQIAPKRLRVRIEVPKGQDSDATWDQALRQLDELMMSNGVTGVEYIRDPSPVAVDPRSGKYRRIWRDFT
ncbi:MAG: hypothetical protein GY762_02250, partial [Proteobacteria bacterium]|nr:hypothetical protein [Pseudomonadota bacterium]